MVRAIAAMAVGWALVGSAVASEPVHPLARPGVEGRLRKAAALVHKGDYTGADALLRSVMPTAEDRERVALDALRTAVDTLDAGDLDAARHALMDVVQQYPDTQASQYAQSVLAEQAVVGQPAPPLTVDHWIQGEASWPWPGATLLVFFEVWCPHCQREVPALQRYADAFVLDGLQVVGITRMSRGVTEADVIGFAGASGVGFALGYDADGDLSEAYGVQGIPSAAIVRDGVVVWRGHPQLLDADRLQRVLAAPRTPSADALP
ncbi:MAG: TlpA family protein disulfide reductase [Alphaproteobacteria bacterium]|nr:TlpA family protein disulfide reductase [Alphaproteobacteria bacterium]